MLTLRARRPHAILVQVSQLFSYFTLTPAARLPVGSIRDVPQAAADVTAVLRT